MNSIEVSRQRAERLHLDAVAAGHNPKQPYAFALAEANKRKLEVERLPKGDVRLFGARAVYDPDALLILHEDTGDPFINAFLVAHEIGHVDLGGQAEPTKTTEINPVRASENVPMGVGRVADYSRRQRREVQMDLFAREFLLPRLWLRTLHLEGMSAAAIAVDVGAPHAVVAQQLLDALLLPKFEPEPIEDVSTEPLKPDQAAAATHEGTAFLLEAGPGTGKTHTLVGRVDHLLSRDVDAAKILILTFSNKAAAELSERVAAKHPVAAAKIWAGTFHSFGLDVIRRFHERVGRPPAPRIIDRSDAIALLEVEYPSLGLVHFKNLSDPAETIGTILTVISRANDEVVDAAGYRALADAMSLAASNEEEREAAERHVEVATVFNAYERVKLARGVVDFGDLVALPVRLCESHADVREYLAGCYEHVLVDEYQDVNRSSVRLLKAICGDGRNLWAVGDAKQSIYRFRGASAYNMTRFDQQDFPGAQRGRLVVNYRSHQEVVDTFLGFAAGMPSVRGTDISLRADRGASGQLPAYRSVDSAPQEVAAVAEAIEELRAEGYSYRDQAVLSSGNDRLGRFAEGLERLGIPVLYLGSLFEREEIKDLLCILSLLVDGRAMGLVRVAAMSGYSVPIADVALLISHLKDETRGALEWVPAIRTLDGLSTEGRTALLRIAALIDGFTADADPWTVMTAVLLDSSRAAADMATSTDVRGRARGVAVWQFMNFLSTRPPGAGHPVTRLLDKIRRLVLYADDRDLRQLPVAAQGLDAVRLMTMHGSKGLEFRAIHIPGLANNSLPRSPNSLLAGSIVPPDGLIEGADGRSLDAVRAALSEEQECLFFVALSRARDRILLYSPTKTTDGKNRPRSPFVDRITERITSSRVVPALQLPPDECDSPIALAIEGQFAFTDYQLALYQRCPRRFLYTHILEVGGRRKETAFMRMHAVVEEVIDAMSPRLASGLADGELDAAFEEAWASHGPAEDGYAAEYKRIATNLLRFFTGSVDGFEVQPTPQLRLPVRGGAIVITPDQVVRDPSGNVAMRKVKTGHKKDGDVDGLAAAAFHVAATAHTPGCTVELVHLGDGCVTPVKMTDRVIANRRASIEEMATAVRAGLFPLKEGPTCPRCPAFFVCSQLPAGKLMKKLGS